MNLSKIYEEIIIEDNNPIGNVLYHGSQHKFNKESLNLSRSNLNLDGSFRTASVLNGSGLYVTKNIWMYDYEYVRNPFNKDGTSEGESAEKYSHGDGDVGYIYEINLSNDFHFEKYGFENIDGRNVSKKERAYLLKKGIDGLYDRNSEAVILNSDKISNFNIKYHYNDTMKMVSNMDISNTNDWKNIFNSHPIQEKGQSVAIRSEDIKKFIVLALGKPVSYEEEKYKTHFFNISQNTLEDIFDLMNSNTKLLKQKYPINANQLKYVTSTNSRIPNWKKVE